MSKQTDPIDYDDMRWREMTARMDALTPAEKIAYQKQYDEFQDAAQEYIKKANVLVDRQENEFQM